MAERYLTRVILLPTSVFVSAIFGGAYGSGREVVEFITRHGPVGGLLSIAAITIVLSACLFLCFEIARLARAYDYHSFARTLLGRASPLYGAVIVIALLLTLAVNATASGTLIAGHFGYPSALAVVVFLAAVVALTFLGRRIVEASLVLAFVALILVVGLLAIIIATEHRDAVVASFTEAPRAVEGIGAGLTVALATGGLCPLLIYCGRSLQTRRESGVAAISAGFFGMVPAAAFHLSFMLEYPGIIEHALPTYWLLAAVAPAIVVNVYVLMLYWQMIDTAVAVLWGVVEAVSRRSWLSSAWGRAAIAAAAVGLALLLSSIGLIDLIVQRNSLLFVAFLVVFWLPLLTRGLSLVVRARPNGLPVTELQV